MKDTYATTLIRYLENGLPYEVDLCVTYTTDGPSPDPSVTIEDLEYQNTLNKERED